MSGYEILSIDDLERFQSADGGLVMRPLRSRLGFRPFGLNVWVGEQAGDKVIEPHREHDGPEELYVVLRGTAEFRLDGETFEAPVGTLVHAPPETLRSAKALEPGTTILAMGAKAGEAFAPSGWEDFYIAYSLLGSGDAEGGRAAMLEALARDPESWLGVYNAACFEALAGNTDAALDYLRRAVERNRKRVAESAPGDGDLDSIRDDPRYAELVR